MVQIALTSFVLLKNSLLLASIVEERMVRFMEKRTWMDSFIGGDGEIGGGGDVEFIEALLRKNKLRQAVVPSSRIQNDVLLWMYITIFLVLYWKMVPG